MASCHARLTWHWAMGQAQGIWPCPGGLGMEELKTASQAPNTESVCVCAELCECVYGLKSSTDYAQRLFDIV